jgi:hypothetical protein
MKEGCMFDCRNTIWNRFVCLCRLSRLVAVIAIGLTAQTMSLPAATKLYGMIYSAIDENEKLAAVDKTTAAVTPIGSGITDCCNVTNASTLDAASGVLYFIGSYLSETSQRLFAVNVNKYTLKSADRGYILSGFS